MFTLLIDDLLSLMRPGSRRLLISFVLSFLSFSSLVLINGAAMAQLTEDEIVRPPPPALDEFEKDENGDGVPDGWYNARDVVIQKKGGVSGPHFVRFECTRRGRLARLSRAFGVDGKKYEAIKIGMWLRLSKFEYGERHGEEPSLMIDFLGDNLRQVSRGTMGPWSRTVGSTWTRVVKRIPFPPSTRDAIMSVGLMGAKGELDLDGVTFELVPREEEPTTNLVVNGDFELGDPAPAHWIINNDGQRVFPGYRSQAAIELGRSDSRILTGLAVPVSGVETLGITLFAKGQRLRDGGAISSFFFLDDFGRPVPGSERGIVAFEWGGSFDWSKQVSEVRVPRGAQRAVIQFEKTDNLGKIQIDDVVVGALPAAELASWTPFHEASDTDDWMPVAASESITEKSALDFSFLLSAPAGKNGFIQSKNGRLHDGKGNRARFHGVSVIAPSAYLEPERADQLADRLARSGINLVRLGDLDAAFGPDRSLFDDTRDDTKELDSGALARLDHLIAALKSRGIHVALELQSARRFRDDDEVPLAGSLPPGGGPAALFDPHLTKLGLNAAKELLGHRNEETGLSLAEDPVLAWVTLLGEVSLFDLIERPDDALPGDYAKKLRELGQKSTGGTGRRFWQTLEATHYKNMATALRDDKLKVPIAGGSHWRREPEYAAALASSPLDLIDDRLFWTPSTFVSPEMKSQLWSIDGALNAGARRKRSPNLPYVVGQWCPQTGAWGLPYEAADLLLAAEIASYEDWDALVRRGYFMFPIEWGIGASGTAGGEDIFQIPAVVNASPHIYSLWPHMASILLRDRHGKAEGATPSGGSGNPQTRRANTGAHPRWNPAKGQLVIDTPHTQGIAGWFAGTPATFPNLDVSSDNPYSVVVASSVSEEPIASTQRLLVTAIARVEPTGFHWVDRFKREVADPGRPPFLQEPVLARVAWRRKGKIEAFVLNNAGKRVRPAKVEPLPNGEGVSLVIDGKTPAFHWELVVSE